MDRTRLAWVTAAVVALAPAAAPAKLKVVATLPSLAALVAEVGGDRVEVEAMASPREDPHYVDPRPNLVLKLNRADLLVVNGLDLEAGWLPPLLSSARNAAILTGGKGYLDASLVVDRLEVPAGRVDRAEGDIHAGGNPHFLYDPRSGARVAKAIADRLAALDPEHAGEYAGRLAVAASALDALARREAARFGALPAGSRRVVTYHRSFPYLLAWLGLTEVATLEPKPGIPPDPGHVAGVLSTMRAQGVRVVLQEEFQPRNTSETLAKLTGARLVVLEAGTRCREGERYSDHLRHNLDLLYGALAP